MDFEIAADLSLQSLSWRTTAGQRTDRDVIYDVVGCAACEIRRANLQRHVMIGDKSIII